MTMRDFLETPGASVDTNVAQEFPPTVWLSAADAIGLPLVALSCNVGATQYGKKAFLHCTILTDPDAEEKTISFTERSVAFKQLEPIIARDLTVQERGSVESPYPFTFTVLHAGRSYAIAPVSAAQKESDNIPF